MVEIGLTIFDLKEDRLMMLVYFFSFLLCFAGWLATYWKTKYEVEKKRGNKLAQSILENERFLH